MTECGSCTYLPVVFLARFGAVRGPLDDVFMFSLTPMSVLRTDLATAANKELFPVFVADVAFLALQSKRQLSLNELRHGYCATTDPAFRDECCLLYHRPVY